MVTNTLGYGLYFRVLLVIVVVIMAGSTLKSTGTTEEKRGAFLAVGNN